MDLSRRNVLTIGALLPVLAACGTATDPQTVAAKVLRVGVTGGSAKDTIDPHRPVTYPDQARVLNLYEPLFNRTAAYEIEPLVGESLTPDKAAKVWTLKLRKGVTFHNGEPVTPEDVIFSIQRVLNPDTLGAGAPGLDMIDPKGLKKIDESTVEFTLKYPYALLQDQLAQYALGIVPTDFDLKKPVGTGPFAFKEFTPGGQSTFTAFDGYWRGRPKVDELVIIDFPDDNAKVNALLSGQVEAIDNLPQSQIDAVKSVAEVLISETGAWTPFTMRVDVAPFDDVRVRQAFRLIVDRDQMVAQALNGQGKVGNDLYAPFDSAYATDLPQRKQDLAQAKALLKAAGKENLTVELVTSTGIGSGAVEAAQLFAEQAKQAGVTVKLRNVDATTFYGEQYLSWPFAQDFWFTRTYLPQVGNGSLPSSPYNETHWKHPEFGELIKSAMREVDEVKRADLLRQAQKIEYEEGGYIVWGFKNQVDAHSKKVTGFVADKNLPLSNYQFRLVSFVQQ